MGIHVVGMRRGVTGDNEEFGEEFVADMEVAPRIGEAIFIESRFERGVYTGWKVVAVTHLINRHDTDLASHTITVGVTGGLVARSPELLADLQNSIKEFKEQGREL